MAVLVSQGMTMLIPSSAWRLTGAKSMLMFRAYVPRNSKSGHKLIQNN